jgi:two-component system sensor histidine kinase SenX3
VTDQGLGIAPDEQRKVFERFYRTRAVRNTNIRGSGIGLALVKHIAEAHGGDITVESVSGKGATFTLTLPVVAIPQEAEGTAVQTKADREPREQD